ncbi:hypothetical protein [Marinimicrobium sp. C2-29]|uniref:hypothetical protein n=1 Tax=Marinimicrobium sp. C2-29 TaxID=3139825 RepID=UPI00313A07F4
MKTVIGAGLSQSISQQGGRFYYMEGLGEIEIKLKTGGDTRRFVLKPGKGIAMREGERFDGLEIVNLLNVSQEVEFEVSDREVFDNRVTGSVYVIDANKEKSSAGKTFIRPRVSVSAVGEYASILLENESGHEVSVGNLSLSCNKAGRLTVDVLSDVSEALADASHVWGTGLEGVVKNIVGAKSKIKAYPGTSTQNFLQSEAAAGVQTIINNRVAADEPEQKNFDYPIVIPSGAGMMIRAGEVTEAGLTAVFEWEE